MAAPTISETLGAFVAGLDLDRVDAAVRHRATLLLMDSIGVALASASLSFGHIAAAALAEVERGASPVIGSAERLTVRDAALVNGMLIHGIDFDDTSIYGRVHPSSACVPGALALGAHLKASGAQMLAAYIAGLEGAIRLGAVAQGGFQKRGFHPSGVIGVFGGTFVAGRLLGLDAHRLAMAQGIAYSAAAGNQEFTTEMAWTKRFHPGWAATAGITAATLAKGGFTGPLMPYEGRFGLYRLYLGAVEGGFDYARATADLGARWLLQDISVKPLAACYFNIPLIDAAARAARESGISADKVAEIRVLVPEAAIATVCEPRDAKRRPADGYTAQFSAYFATATGFLTGGFTLADIAPDRLTDPAILALADKVTYAADPETSFPAHYGGAVSVRATDGRSFTVREDIDRGSPQRPLSETEMMEKFLRNAELIFPPRRAREALDLILGVARLSDVSRLAEILAAPETRPGATRL
ncbi:MmgE/PrpD family protein [Aquabacter spiritensis]|uniref:2-methylcitrate dehydratase PrpD n=1 Tax=Aquabacter spiritensis TaxID=933073 RepID=A0A4R3LNR8_9HYPH|nr:MmgE/PrpD family protein [Aquabacter spiritensis]TCT01099.1 2-methylcitrate dehydratase PrpD [Aquabacter spiritensis]